MKRILPDGWAAIAEISDNFLVADPPKPINPDDCVNCGGVDYVYYYNATGGPYRNHPGRKSTYVEGKGWFTGELVGEHCPVCNGEMRNEFMTAISGLSNDELTIRLSDFKPLPGKEVALQNAQYLLSLTPRPMGFVTFWGDYGVGKTTLLKGLTNQYRMAGVSSHYTRMSDILDAIRRTYADDVKVAAEQVVKEYRDYQALMIDEVDRIYATEWAKDVMFSLLDYRYVMRNRLLTVMATNQSPDAMPDGLSYLASRMTEGIITHVAGDDVRPAMSKIDGEVRQ